MALRPSSLVSVRGLLRADTALAVILPEAERLVALNRRFADVVPKAVARACRVASIRDQTALVYCANGAAASRVRAQAKGVARALAQVGREVSAVKVKVNADWCVPDRPAKQGLSATALDAFHELENALPEGELKDAVERLLARHRPG